MVGGIDSRKSNFGFLITFSRGCIVAVEAKKVCCFVYYRGKIHYNNKSLQINAMDEMGLV